MTFNPFENRQCRNVRNSLGHDFVTAIERNDQIFFKGKTQSLLITHAEKHITEYILLRQTCFKKAVNQVSALNNNTDIFFKIYCILWNLELFFECHEWLEKKWMTAKGDNKKLLQALIMAAVAYEQRQYDRIPAAKKLGIKSANRLRHVKPLIPDFLDADLLIPALTHLSPPPKFVY